MNWLLAAIQCRRGRDERDTKTQTQYDAQLSIPKVFGIDVRQSGVGLQLSLQHVFDGFVVLLRKRVVCKRHGVALTFMPLGGGCSKRSRVSMEHPGHVQDGESRFARNSCVAEYAVGSLIFE